MLSVRRATWGFLSPFLTMYDFYPRPPRGGRLSCSGILMQSPPDFYPRPPRGGRPLSAFLPSTAFRFLSTPSARRATCFERTVDLVLAISIHALREEGDHRGHRKYPRQYHFYPRPPRGGRLRKAQKDLGLPYISIHALREEGDELLSEF